MDFNKKQIFSIRKTALGVGSILLGMAILAPTVAADEVTTDVEVTESSVVTTADKETTVSQPTVEEAADTPVITAVETTTISAKTEYAADDSLEYGKTKVVTPAVDGVTETITNYKEVEKPVEMVDQSAKDVMASTEYKYGATDFYHIDDTKEKPSDKIVIDRIFSDVKPMTEEEVKNNQSIRDIVTGVEYLDTQAQNNQVAESHALLKLTSLDGSKPDIYLSSESLDPDNKTLQALLKEYSFEGTTRYSQGTWTGDMTDALKDALYYELLRTSTANLANLAGFRYIDDLVVNDNKEATAVKGYFTSQLPITEQLYADAKADYARYQLLMTLIDVPEKEGQGAYFDEEKGEMVLAWRYNPILNDVESAFDTITHRYNTEKGFKQLPIVYKNSTLSDEERAALEAEIEKLPDTVKADLLKLTITPEEISFQGYRGMTTWASDAITLRQFSEREFIVQTDQGKKVIKAPAIQPFDLFDNLLHELMHAVDIRSGYTVYDYYTYQPDTSFVANQSLGRLSHSDEFLKVFEEYFLNKEDVWEYIRWTPSEAWADSLGECINHKIYGVPYTRYKKIDGVVYEYKPSLAGLNAEYDAMKATVYDVGYSPVEASEFYWESIYKKLFEPEVIRETVVDGVTTKTIPAQDGKVLVGTKPQVTVEVIPYKVVEESDSSQPIDYRMVKQLGQNGQLETKVTYTVDSQTGQVTSQTSQSVIKDAIDEIILVGTKVVTDEVSVVVTEEIVPYSTHEELDAALPVGYRAVKQDGVNGKVQVITTYTKDSKTGQVTSSVERIVLSDTVDEIVLVGVKVIDEIPVTPPHSTEDKVTPQPETPVTNDESKESVEKESPSQPHVKPSTKPSSDIKVKTATNKAFSKTTNLVENTSVETKAPATYSRLAKSQTLPATGEKETGLLSLLGLTALATGLGLTARRRHRG